MQVKSARKPRKPRAKPVHRPIEELTSALAIIEEVYSYEAKFEDNPIYGRLRIVCTSVPAELERLVHQREADIGAILAEHHQPDTCARCRARSTTKTCARCGHRSMDLPPPPDPRQRSERHVR